MCVTDSARLLFRLISYLPLGLSHGDLTDFLVLWMLALSCTPSRRCCPNNGYALGRFNVSDLGVFG